ncbi:MAG: ATP-binding cassette domain-containing protein [Neomegalonema sp.]|nr:ATP-binding cassette domain-containing protein [Neomegalonema sp.]
MSSFASEHSSEPALAIEGLSYAYGPVRALADVSVTLARGQFCALLGPNGAGKSTLFALLTRLFVSRAGRIAVMGHDLGAEPRAALAQMGVVFQQSTLDLDLSVMHNIRYFGALHGLSRRQATERGEAALAAIGLADLAGRKARALSGGQRRRVEIARALIHRPALLLLDEPTVGLDAPSRRAITDHVHALCREQGITALWATHLVDEIEPQDQALILHQGRVRAQGIVADLCAGQSLAERFAALTHTDEAAA